MTLAAIVLHAANELLHAGLPPDTARFDADVLARHVLGCDAVGWLIRQRETATHDFRARFDAVIARRRAREPVAYITGSREFYGRPFLVTRDVLIPRPETELVVDAALQVVTSESRAGSRRWVAADVGTGSGCLAVTLALECPDADVVATDVSPAALRVAEENARCLGAVSRVTLREAPLLDGEVHRFDLVVANPPYVAEEDRDGLQPEVRDYEPPLALFGGPDGLGVIRDLVPAVERGLVAGGWLVMEFGAGQEDGVRAIVGSAPGLDAVRVVPDLAGIPRVLVARKRPRSV